MQLTSYCFFISNPNNQPRKLQAVESPSDSFDHSIDWRVLDQVRQHTEKRKSHGFNIFPLTFVT